MPRRLANLVLLVAVLVLLATGLLPWLFAEPDAQWLYDVHRLAGIALVVSLVWKYAIVRGSAARRLARHDPSLAVSAFASGALLFVVTTGVAWTLGAVSFDRPFAYSMLNLHVFAGVLVAATMSIHALQRLERRPPVTKLIERRAVLRILGMAAVATALAPAVARIAPSRVTGSRHAGSFTANAFPLTIWSFDSVPAIDRRTWRLSITGPAGRTAVFDYDSLGALPRREIDAVIDCTGGWWSEQRWTGVALLDLLRDAAPQASRLRVVSVTGHAWAFAPDELRDALLATHVGGEALTPGHGYPVRLVVPGRRGFQWVKWVDRIEIS